MADETVKHAGWIPGPPSMNVPGSLMPESEGFSGSAAGDDVLKSAGQTMGGTTSMDDSGDSLSTRIMEDMDFTYPSPNQGNLEPTGPRVKGA